MDLVSEFHFYNILKDLSGKVGNFCPKNVLFEASGTSPLINIHRFPFPIADVQLCSS